MKQFLCILFTFILWLLLTWKWPPETADVFVGLVLAFLVATLLAHIYPDNPHKALDPRRWFWMGLYVPYFLYYCVRANLDVAYRVLHPDMPIRPGIVKVRTELASEMAKTFLANSITLTPGTLTVDINGQDLYIHWIYVEGEDPEVHTAVIVKRFERLLRRVFE
ncbi:MAG TPA: Na+/H+ antiporter subunit E [Phycisphaerae bacterium]|nr:Na+/H+ antiporter subunit E [Phycisphaerae bacterium]